MTAQFRQRLLASTLLFGAVSYANPALAQAAPPSAQPDAVADQAIANSTPGPQNEIVVTGSRIRRPDLEGSSPIVIVGQQDIALKAGSANIEQVLNDLPQVTATSTSTSNNPGGGVATVNLRGIGTQRTLVLVDGRRYVSYDVNQVVDLNTIPSSLIERVDVVTGGESAVYGSDAIAGVVNFILKRNFSGVQLDSQYNLTQRGDGQVFDIGLTLGTNFADNRGNITIYTGYTKRKPTFAGERDFSIFALNDDEDGSPLYPGGSGSVPQGRVNVPGLGLATGLNGANGKPCNSQTFNNAGESRCFTTADQYNYSPVNYLQVPQTRFLTSAMGQYEISEHIVPYVEAQFINNRVSAQLAPTPINSGTPFGNGTIGGINLLVNSPFFSPAFQAALATLDATDATPGNGVVRASTFNFRTVGVGPRANFDERNAFRVVTGVKGKLFAGFDYDGNFMYARTKNSQRQLGNVAIDKFLQAASDNIFFNPTTGATSTTPLPGYVIACGSAAARDAGCVPANIYGLGNISQAANDFIGVGATNLEEYTTQVASLAFTNSNLFDFGAGGVGVAFGAEWRREEGAVVPDANLSSGNVAGFNPGKPTGGSYTVREFFAETRVPILRDNFIHKLELNGAVRQSHYSNAVGNVLSYSFGAELSPVRDLTLRGQYARTVRGPSVNELFLGNTVSFNGNNDQCGTAAALTTPALNAICVAQFTAAGAPVALIGNPIVQDTSVNPLTFIGGNPLLKQESAKTLTVGAVFQPRFLPRFTATVDYYKIKIDGYIGGVGTDNIGVLCFTQNIQAYCDRITRNSVGEVETVTDTLANSGGLKTSGVDVTAGYYFPLGNMFGDGTRLGFNFSGTRLLKNDYTPVIGLDNVIRCAGHFGARCGVPTPKWRHTLRTTLGAGPVSLSGQWRYIGSVTDDNLPVFDAQGNLVSGTIYASERFKAFSYFDATTSFKIGDHYTLNMGVTNIFDKKPPLAASTQNGGNGEQSNTFPSVYDVLGRSFFVSGKLRF